MSVGGAFSAGPGLPSGSSGSTLYGGLAPILPGRSAFQALSWDQVQIAGGRLANGGEAIIRLAPIRGHRCRLLSGRLPGCLPLVSLALRRLSGSGAAGVLMLLALWRLRRDLGLGRRGLCCLVLRVAAGEHEKRESSDRADS